VGYLLELNDTAAHSDILKIITRLGDSSLAANEHHPSDDYCLDDKMEDYQNCSVFCVTRFAVVFTITYEHMNSSCR